MKKASQDIFEPEMPVVPSDWAVLPFEQAAEVISDKGKRVKQGSYLPAGKIPVIDQGQDTIGGYTNDENMAFDDGLPVILFGDHTRSLKYVDKRFAVGAEGVKILRPREGYVPKFFYYLLRSLQIPSRGYSRHFQFLRKFHFPLAPEEQQKGIVAEIEKQFSRLDEAVANLKRIKANLKRYKASVIKAAVEGKLTEDWRKQHPNVEPARKLLERILAERRAKWKGKGKEKYKETPVPDTTNLPPLPNTWIWSSVETICSDVVDCPHSTPQWEATGRVCLRTTEFQPGRLVLADVRFVSQSTYEKRIQRLKPMEHDVVYSREGGILGVACIIPHGIDPCLGQRMMLLRSHALFTPNLLMHWLNSWWTLARVRSLTGGSASPHLNVGEVRRFPVPVAPLAEQGQIIAEVECRLSVIEELESAVEANLTRADRLRQAILQRAFGRGLHYEKKSHI